MHEKEAPTDGSTSHMRRKTGRRAISHWSRPRIITPYNREAGAAAGVFIIIIVIMIIRQGILGGIFAARSNSIGVGRASMYGCSGAYGVVACEED